MSLSRRELLRLAAIVGLTPMALGLTGCDDGGAGDDGPEDGGDGGVDSADQGFEDAARDTLDDYSYDGELGPETVFQHGVASGDPLPDALIIWSRASVETDSQAIWWEIATDPEFRHRVQIGEVTAAAEADWTVKVDVQDLEAGTTYYYRFKALGRTSVVGRGRTAPRGGVERIRFAVVSCASGGHGYFHAYQSLAEQPDFDAILHLGDYIYEYASGDYGVVRELEPPHETVTLDDYRRRYRWYREDPAMRAVHQQHPFIVIWDDHEIVNNGWRDGGDNHNPEEGEGEFAVRKAAGQQAFHEWLPIRETGDREKIFRRLQYGDLLDLLLLDTRYFDRDEQDRQRRDDPDRSILGEEQEGWLNEMLAQSTATWRILGQQVMMGQLLINGNAVNNDQWDGYDGSRRRLYSTIRDTAGGNVVVLTGDIHSSWANELTEEPLDPGLYNPETGEGSVAVEFVVPAVTSPGLDIPGVNSPAFQDLLRQYNPHIKYFETGKRGYLILEITADRVQSDWYNFESIAEESVEPETFRAGYFVASGETNLQAADGPSSAQDGPALAPN